MPEFSIRDKCRVNTNRDTDVFVGIKCEDGDISISFPLGFRLAEGDRELRRDIMLLISTIGNTIGHSESVLKEELSATNQIGFPIQAYLAIIYDYMSRGYYIEREIEHNVSRRGKINWSKTIKSCKPVVQNDEAYYLDFVVRKNTINENNLITLIHEFCVYESFLKMGWLFTSFVPRNPRIKCNKKAFLSILKEKMSRTFNDKNKTLFGNMILVIENMQNEDAPENYKYGTYRFEYVWESLIDRVFGVENKKDYFPKTTWRIGNHEYDNASLEPDTIMLFGKDVYVLDAKYYKYGATGNYWDLPESSSINKQITYGEYVTKNASKNQRVFNAFLMPYSSDIEGQGEMIAIGEAIGNWRKNDELYERIQGILVDVKHLMQITVREDFKEITKLANCIETSVLGGYE